MCAPSAKSVPVRRTEGLAVLNISQRWWTAREGVSGLGGQRPSRHATRQTTEAQSPSGLSCSTLRPPAMGIEGDMNQEHQNQQVSAAADDQRASDSQLKYRLWMQWVGLVIFVPLSGFALYVGTIDSLTGSSLTPRLFGIALVLAALTMFAGIRGLFSGGGRGGSLALVASGVGALVGLLMVGIQLAGFDLDWRLAVWAAMVVLPGLFGIFLLRTGARTALPRRIQGTLSVTVVIALLQFWYTNQYLPAGAHGVEVGARLEKHGQEISPAATQAQPLVPLLATVSVKNTTRIRQRFVGSMLGLYGVKVRPHTSALDDAGFAEELAGAAEGGTRANLFAASSDLEMLAAEPFFLPPGNNFVEPGRGYSRTFVLYVPKGTYSFVRLAVSILTVNARKLVVDRDPVFGPKKGSWGGKKAVLRTWRVKEPSVLSAITRNRRYVHVNFVYGDEWDYPDVKVYIDRTARHRKRDDLIGDDFITRMDIFYGLSGSSARAELAL